MIIRTEIEPGHTVVHLVGRFDAHEAESFRRTVGALLSDETAIVRLDLAQVAFVDSTALAELVRLQKAAKALGGEVVLVNPSDPVRVILEITELAELFTIESSTADQP